MRAQAPGFIKVFGPEAKLHRERLELEVRYYREVAEFVGDEVVSRFLPRILHTDFERMVFVSEFLGGTLLDEQLLAEDSAAMPSTAVMRGLGAYMGCVHASTHSTRLAVERVTGARCRVLIWLWLRSVKVMFRLCSGYFELYLR